MDINNLIGILNYVKEEYGNIDVNIKVNPKFILTPDNAAINLDDIKNVFINEDMHYVTLTNEIVLNEVYKGIKSEIIYDPDEDIYRGSLVNINDFDGKYNFTASSEFSAKKKFVLVVEQYIEDCNKPSNDEIEIKEITNDDFSEEEVVDDNVE